MATPTTALRRPREGTGSPVLDVPGGNLALDLFVLEQHLGNMLDVAFRGTGVTPSQYAVYSQLHRRQATPGRLCQVLGLRPATLSGHLAAIERRGHLTRHRHEADGRSVVLVLTDEGRTTTQACRRRMRRAVSVLDAEVGPAEETAALRSALGRLDRAVIAAGATLVARQR